MKEQEGMKIISGTTGAGMSSTLARHMLEKDDAQLPGKIIRLEDPVEILVNSVAPVPRNIP